MACRAAARSVGGAMTDLRVLIAGGGVAALESVLALHALAGDRVSIELLAPGTDFVQRPSSVRSPFTGERRAAELLRSRRTSGTPRRARRGRPDGHTVRTDRGRPVSLRPPDRRHRRAAGRGRARRDHVPRPDQRRRRRGGAARARERVLFTVPAAAGWTLPVYELALLAAHDRKPGGPELMVVAPEPRPLNLFGAVASDAVARLLDAPASSSSATASRTRCSTTCCCCATDGSSPPTR